MLLLGTDTKIVFAGNDTLEKLEFDESLPLFFDIETRGLHGKIEIASFYQGVNVYVIRNPNIIVLSALLVKYHIVCHNLSYDISCIQQQLVEGSRLHFSLRDFDDTLFLSKLYFFDKDSYSLDLCIQYALDYNPYRALGEKKKLSKTDWAKGNLEDKEIQYTAFDVYYLAALYDKVKCVKDEQLYKLDKALLKYCLEFQCNGLPVDLDKLANYYGELQKRQVEINLPINSKSYKQVREYLQDDRSDATGLATVILEGNTRAKAVLEDRQIRTAMSYLDKFNEPVIYGEFSPTAKSGRVLCNNQNLQQIPRKSKKCFGISEDGDNIIVFSDFSQLELRCVCQIANDTLMKQLYKEGVDVHTTFAKSLYSKEEPTEEERFIAKTCNFLLLYGGSAKMLRTAMLRDSNIVISENEAYKIIRAWKRKWEGIAEWQQRGIRAWQNGEIWQTPLGRKYKAKLLTDMLNIRVQGMGAEVAKTAIHYMVTKSNLTLKYLRNFVHDSYLFVVPKKEAKFIANIVGKSMKEAWNDMSQSEIPMPVKVLTGYNWGDIEKGIVVDTYNF